MGKVHTELGESNFQGGRSFSVEDRSGDDAFDIPANAQVFDPNQMPDIPDHEVVNPFAQRQHFPTQVPQQPQQTPPQWQAQQAVPQQHPGRIQPPQGHVQPTTTEEAMSLRKQMLQQSKTALADDARKRIEALIGLCRGRDNVEIMDGELRVVFTIRTLKGKEQREQVALTHKLQQSKNPAEIYDLRHEALKYSIELIDGVPVDQFLGIHNYGPEDRAAAKLKFVENLDEATISQLYRRYEKLMQENILKYVPKTAADVEEVAAQIKKSSEDAGA